jgi:ABC-type uncharacterized transport system permease subunit
VGLFDAMWTVLRRDNRFFRPALSAFQVAVVFQFVAIVEHSVELRHIAANNFFQTATLCAFLFAVVFLVVFYKYSFAGLSIFVFPLVAVLTLLGSMGTPVATWADGRLRDAWLLTHIVLVLMGFAGLLLCATAALFYLIQERRLKQKGAGMKWLLMDNPPPLETLDSLITKSMSVGFVAMTLAVITASTWAFIESGTKWIGEAKIAISLMTWGFYLLMVFLRISAGWRGRKAAILALAVVGFAALTWATHSGLRPLLLR